MALDPAAQKLVQDWIKEKCPELRCAACGGRRWEAGDLTVAFAVPNYAPGQPLQAFVGANAPNTTVLPLACVECGYAVFFAAKAIGLIF
jgi:hypothetical protein